MSITNQNQPNSISVGAVVTDSVLVLTIVLRDVNVALADKWDDDLSSSSLTATDNGDGTVTLVATITPDVPVTGATYTIGHEVLNANIG
jgi:hypothetical protein